MQQDYSDIADKYDQTRFETPSGQFLARMDGAIVREFVSRTNAAAIVDVPVGTGRVLDYLRDLPVRITGVDVTIEMLQRAQTRALEGRHALMLGDAAALPFGNGEIECITSLRFFHLFRTQDREVFCHEFARVVRPGGYLICSFTNGWYGGGMNWVKKVLGYQTVHFLAPRELSRLFPGWTRVAMRGNYLPLYWRIARRVESSEPFLGRIASLPVLRSLCWEYYFLLQKPVSHDLDG